MKLSKTTFAIIQMQRPLFQLNSYKKMHTTAEKLLQFSTVIPTILTLHILYLWSYLRVKHRVPQTLIITATEHCFFLFSKVKSIQDCKSANSVNSDDNKP